MRAPLVAGSILALSLSLCGQAQAADTGSLLCVKDLVPLPSLPNLPGLPTIPELPCLPQLPGVPNLTELPTLPSLPDASSLATSVLQDAGSSTPAPGDTGASKPDYSSTVNMFSFPDIRFEALPKGKLPYLGVKVIPNLQKYQQNASTCRDALINQKPAPADKCPQYEWKVPYSLEADSISSARDLRAAWQRFEDRYYWRAIIELNNPVSLITHCLISVGNGVNPTAPRAKTHLPAGAFPSALDGKLPTSEADPQLHLDSYLPWPQVPASDYCGGITPDLWPMYLAGRCFFTPWGTRLFCIEGDTVTLNPLAPRPIAFDMNRARDRVASAVKKAHTDYLVDYQEDTIKALLLDPDKRKYFFPLPWQSNVPGDGAVIAPIMNTSLSLTQFSDLAKTAKAKLGGLIGTNAYPYYFQWAYQSPSLLIHALPGRHEALGTPPGLWQLEEFKRLLSATSAPLQERLGYATFYQAWNELKTTFLPEDVAAKALRPVTYLARGDNIILSWPPVTVPLPAPVPISPYYPIGLPFVGPQMQFDWISVPEGYSIPRVKGQPLFDYAPLLK